MEDKFFNQQEALVDLKHRVAIPERYMRVLRRICPQESGRLGATITQRGSIKLMPMPLFDHEQQGWERLDNLDEDESLLRTMYASYADVLTLDKQNRVRLNDGLVEFCEIKRQVIFIGQMDHLQVFDLDRWKQLREQGKQALVDSANKVAAKARERLGHGEHRETTNGQS